MSRNRQPLALFGEGAWNWPAGLLAALVAAGVYLPRMAPDLLWGDAAELQMAAWLAGLAHPTGYPLFLMVGWAWTHALAPWLLPTTSLNLMVALLGALAVGGLAWLLARLLEGWTPALPPAHRAALAVGGALWFALSPTFWSQALIAEVYTLHALFVVILLAAHATLLRARDDQGRERAFLLTAFCYGLSLTHHRTTLLWGPGTLAFLALAWPQWWRSRRRLFLALALVSAPQLLYLYVAWRGPLTPYLHQPLGNGQALNLYDGSLHAFLDHVAGTMFRGELGRVAPADRLALVGRLWAENVTWPGLLLGGLGVLWLARAGAKVWLAFTGTAFAAHLLFGLVYGIGDIEVMLIPAWLVWALWGAVGLGLWVARRPSFNRAMIGLLVLGLLVAWQYTAWQDTLDRSDSRSARSRWEAILAAGPSRGAVLVTNDRNEMVPFWYLQFVEGRRPDLLGLFPLITPRPEHANVARLTEYALGLERPVVLIKPMPGLEVKFDVRPLRDPLWLVEGPAPMPERTPLAQTVAPQLNLAGWSANPDRLRPGEPITVTLAWRVEVPLDRRYHTFVHLVAADGTGVAQSDHQPGGDFYPSNLWEPGETIRDRHVISLPPSLPDQAVAVRAGFYELVDGRTHPLGQTVTAGWLVPASAPFEPAVAGDNGLAHFVNGLRLDKVQVEPDDEALLVRLAWTCAAVEGCGPQDPALFVHLVPGLDPAPPVSQYDGPVLPGYPVPAWPVGARTTVEVRLTWPPGPLPERLSLWLGLYDPASGARVPLVNGKESFFVRTIERREAP